MRIWKTHWSLTLLLLFISFFLVNWVVQSFYKPSEVIGLAEGPFFKTPDDTWKAYEHLFRKHSTPICTPAFLAALAQTESSGNPIARTRWVWRWRLNPFEIYQPASSSVGLYQITDPTFSQARELCIHEGKVARVGHWYNWNSCWFNGLYNRLIPSHATEMTSAHLHTQTVAVASGFGKPQTLKEKRKIAAMIHLCGPSYARSRKKGRFQVGPNDTCAGHRVDIYLRKVGRLTDLFNQLSEESRP